MSKKNEKCACKVDDGSKQYNTKTVFKNYSHSEETVSSSSDDDLKDLIETLESYELNEEQECNQNEYGSYRVDVEETSEYNSDENSFYETAKSVSISDNDSLTRGSPSTIKTRSSSEINLLQSVINEDAVDDEEEEDDVLDDTSSKDSITSSPSHSPNLHSKKSYNTCLDQVLGQQSPSSSDLSFCKCSDNSNNLREKCYVVGIPETTIDEGITRIIPMKFLMDENGNHSLLPRQLFDQMSSSENNTLACAFEDMTEESTINSTSPENILHNSHWELGSTKSSSSTTTSSLEAVSSHEEDVKLGRKFTLSNLETSNYNDLHARNSSPDFKSISSNESFKSSDELFCIQHQLKASTSSSTSSSEKGLRKNSSISNYNSEEDQSSRKNEYKKLLESLNLKSSDDSEDLLDSSEKRSASLASAVKSSVICSFSSRSFQNEFSREAQQSFNLNTNTNTSEPLGARRRGKRKKSTLRTKPLHTMRNSSEEKLSNPEIARTINLGTNTIIGDPYGSPLVRHGKEKKQKFAFTSDELEEKDLCELLDDSLTQLNDSSSNESLDASVLLDLHDERCAQNSKHHPDFDFKDFDVTELNLALSSALGDDCKLKTSHVIETEKPKQMKHHDQRPKMVDTVDKILRLSTEDVALSGLKANKTDATLKSIDGSVIDEELQAHAVDITKPKPVDEDTFYWVPCDFKDYLEVSDRPLVSEYFPKYSVSSQFCCVMVREFVHVHFYLRLHEQSQPSHVKYNILIWDKNRQPVAHFRSPCPIFFEAGQAHHVSTFSNQAMQELLAQEMLVVSCHVTSFAKWQKKDDEKTPWYFSNNNTRLKSMDDTMSLYCSQEYADVTLESADGQKYPAHRAIICRESELLKQSVDSSTSNFVRININGRLLKQMLYVFYAGELPPISELEKISVPLPRWQEICELLVAADRYQAQRLSRKCQAWLGVSLNRDNVCTVYALAVRLGLASLTHACRSFITKHRDVVVKSTEWLTLKDSPAAVADLLLNTDIYDRQGGTQSLQLESDSDLYCLNDFSIAPTNLENKLSFKDILFEFGYTANP